MTEQGAGRTIAAVAVVAVVLWMARPIVEVLLLGFAGLLLAIFLRGIGVWIASHTPLGEKTGVALYCVAVIGALAVAGTIAAPDVGRQIDELGQALPRAAENATARLEQYGWGRKLLEVVETGSDQVAGTGTLRRASGILSGTFGVLGSALVVLFIGLFVAFDPEPYRAGVLALVPRSRRARYAAVLAETGRALRQWMLSVALAMLVVGVLTGVGLMVLGVPLALTLALIAATMTLVPNFGPVIAAVPAILLALMASPVTAAYVVALYVAIQVLETYILTPLVQRKTLSLPSALTILAQVLMAALGGALGVIVATPLCVAAIILVKRLYVEDVLGDDVAVAAGGPAIDPAARRGDPSR